MGRIAFASPTFRTSAAIRRDFRTGFSRPATPLRRDGYLTRKEFVWPKGGRHDDNPRVEPEDLDLVSTLYDSGVAYMDSQLGPFLRFLETSDLAENTIVALTSDHGEALGEHGEAAHGYLWDDNLMVPLMVWLPGRRQRRKPDSHPSSLSRPGADAPRLRPAAPATRHRRSQPSTVDRGARRAKARLRPGALPPPPGAESLCGSRTASSTFYATPPGHPSFGREILYDLRADRLEQQNLAPDHSSVPDLRALAREELEQRLSGLRIRLENQSERVLEGSLGRPSNHALGRQLVRSGLPVCSLQRSRTPEFRAPAGSLVHADPEPAHRR